MTKINEDLNISSMPYVVISLIYNLLIRLKKPLSTNNPLVINNIIKIYFKKAFFFISYSLTKKKLPPYKQANKNKENNDLLTPRMYNMILT
jgi:hypothetical protein